MKNSISSIIAATAGAAANAAGTTPPFIQLGHYLIALDLQYGTMPPFRPPFATVVERAFAKMSLAKIECTEPKITIKTL